MGPRAGFPRPVSSVGATRSHPSEVRAVRGSPVSTGGRSRVGMMPLRVDAVGGRLRRRRSGLVVRVATARALRIREIRAFEEALDPLFGAALLPDFHVPGGTCDRLRCGLIAPADEAHDRARDCPAYHDG